MAQNRIARPDVPAEHSDTFPVYERKWGDTIAATPDTLKTDERKPLEDYLLPIDDARLISIVIPIPLPINPYLCSLSWPARHEECFLNHLPIVRAQTQRN